MARFLLLLGGADVDKRSGNAELAPVLYARFASWLKSVQEEARIVAHEKLRDQRGARLSVRGGEVVEGPFMETKEAVGGFLLLEVDTLEQAVAIARRCPVLELQNGYVEVRVIEEVREVREVRSS